MIQVKHLRYFKNSEVKVVELPFTKDFMSAIIILPNKKTEINISKVN